MRVGYYKNVISTKEYYSLSQPSRCLNQLVTLEIFQVHKQKLQAFREITSS